MITAKKIKFALVAMGLLSLFTNFIPVQAGVSIVPSNQNKRQFSFEIAPGKSADGEAVLENLDNKPVTVRLYGADATQSNIGTFALTTLSTPQTEIGKWVTIKTPQLDLKANEKKNLDFTVSVPKNITPGIYSGGIAAETVDKASTGAVKTSSRVIVKIFISVSGAKKTEFSWDQFSYDKGTIKTKPTFKLHYKNDGNTMIIIDQQIQITSLFWQTQVYDLPAATILPGKDLTIDQRWDEQPFFGIYKATSFITFSEYDVLGNKRVNSQNLKKSIEILIPLDLSTSTGKTILGATLAAVILLIGVLFYLLRQSKKIKKGKIYTVKEEDDIKTIAEKNGVSWSKIAKVNNLKKPYRINEGQKLIIPSK